MVQWFFSLIDNDGETHWYNYNYESRFRNGGKDDLIHLDQVNCTGAENALHLLSCNRNILRDHDCLHTEDVAIICSELCFPSHLYSISNFNRLAIISCQA